VEGLLPSPVPLQQQQLLLLRLLLLLLPPPRLARCRWR
jgi:hypothetical protein